MKSQIPPSPRIFSTRTAQVNIPEAIYGQIQFDSTLVQQLRTPLPHPDMGKDPDQFSNQIPDIMQIQREELIRALHNKEFQLFLQPQIDMKSKELIGAEALVRWKHPTRGLLLPGAFLPYIIEYGLSLDLDSWMLAEVSRTQEILIKNGQIIRIAVNVSSPIFEHGAFFDFIDDILQNNIQVEIEITEDTFTEFNGQTIRALSALQTSRIPICLDDFGIGYSSLLRLHTFPFSKMKIDKLFISMIGKSRAADIIIASIIDLANALNVQLIAEGVETKKQLNFLFQHGCYNIQGFMISKALSLDNFQKFLHSWMLIDND